MAVAPIQKQAMISAILDENSMCEIHTKLYFVIHAKTCEICDGRKPQTGHRASFVPKSILTN